MHHAALSVLVVGLAGLGVAGCSSTSAGSCNAPKSAPAVVRNVPGTIKGGVDAPVSAHVGDKIVISATFTLVPRSDPTITDSAVACIASSTRHNHQRTTVVYARSAGTARLTVLALEGPVSGDGIYAELTITP